MLSSPHWPSRNILCLERLRLYSPYTTFIRQCIAWPQTPSTAKNRTTPRCPSSYSPACSVVDDNLCNHLLFGVKPHCHYETSNVTPVSVSLPIDGATIQAVTWCHLTCNAKLDALTEFHLYGPYMSVLHNAFYN
ncbi:hypothetical protein TNCV_3148271 [Trichonephila clavipes]|nr:hypothetical protein TNCV_3148271 [Trichonephila clavipes]